MNLKRLIGIALAILAMVVSFLIAQPGPQVTWTWTPPTTGSAVVQYVAQYQLNGDVEAIYSITDTRLTLPYPEGGSCRLRVAGIDALGRQGLYSDWSALLSDPGLPGQPGTPVLTIN